MNKISLYIMILSISSCSIFSDNKKKVQISVKSISKDFWEVSYKLPEPVKSVKFLRQTNQFRESRWTVLDKDLVIKNIKNEEVLTSVSGRSFSSFKVQFKSYFKHTPKDYEFFQPFSDGGIIFYTGHLYLSNKWNSEITITSKKSQNIVVMGKVSKQEVLWLDKENKGTYVYIGDLEPIETDTVIAVIDSGLPKWIKKSMNTFLPKLFKYYTKETGQDLTFKPIVYFNYKPTDMRGTSNSGGTLPGIVQLTVEGKEWAIEDKGNLERIVWFLAHEAAHFWNGQMFDNTDWEAAWLHEGGADAFAYRALYNFGIIDKKELFNRYSSALNRCLLGLDGASLNASDKNRKFGNYYMCGSTIMLMAESAIKQKNNQLDLFSFWRDLLEQSKSNNQLYSRADFHKLLTNKYKQSRLPDLIDKLELKDVKHQDSLIKEMISLTNIKFTEDNSKASRRFLFGLNRINLEKLMKYDCNGYSSVDGQGKGIVIRGKKSCKTFKNNSYDIISIGGITISSKNLYRPSLAMASSCNTKGIVSLRMASEKKLDVSCKQLNIYTQNWIELNEQK